MQNIYEHSRLGPCKIELEYTGIKDGEPNGNYMWFVRSRTSIREQRDNKYKYTFFGNQNKDYFHMLIGVTPSIEEAGIIPLMTKTKNPMTERAAQKKFIKATIQAGKTIKFKKD